MNARIRIIKRGTLGKPNRSPIHHAEKTARERERETATMVQGWVAEMGRAKAFAANGHFRIASWVGPGSTRGLLAIRKCEAPITRFSDLLLAPFRVSRQNEQAQNRPHQRGVLCYRK